MAEFGGGIALTQGRGSWLFERIVETGSVVLSAVGGDPAGTTAAHRSLASSQSRVSTVLSALRERAVAACRGRRVVAVQDTTALSLRGAAGRHGLGPGGDGRQPGFFVHPVVAVDAQDEAVLGLRDAQVWTRGPTLAGPDAGGPAPEPTGEREGEPALAPGHASRGCGAGGGDR